MTASPEGRRRRVLVVDDEPDIRTIAVMSLERVGGWEVLAAADGQTAVAMAREHDVDAVLLDVMMPGLDGPATVGLLREDPRTAEIPVVLLTAKVQSSDRQRFAALGVAGAIAKPFDPMTLPREVALLLGWS